MSENSKDELITAQKEVIGILFEVIKRLHANNDLDHEYFQIITSGKKDNPRLEEIISERRKNAEITSKLLEKLET